LPKSSSAQIPIPFSEFVYIVGSRIAVVLFSTPHVATRFPILSYMGGTYLQYIHALPVAGMSPTTEKKERKKERKAEEERLTLKMKLTWLHSFPPQSMAPQVTSHQLDPSLTTYLLTSAYPRQIVKPMNDLPNVRCR
jgi:hypothetical protein